jgi:hypothetical protein
MDLDKWMVLDVKDAYPLVNVSGLNVPPRRKRDGASCNRNWYRRAMPQKEGWGTASSPRFGNVDLGVPSWYQMMDEWHSIRLTIH